MIRVLVIAFLSLFSSAAFADYHPTAGDREAIDRIIKNGDDGWITGNIELATRDYSDDTDWMDAAGKHTIGRKALAALQQEMRSRIKGEQNLDGVANHTKFFSPTVAVIYTDFPKGHAMRVVAKRSQRWEIVSEVSMIETVPPEQPSAANKK